MDGSIHPRWPAQVTGPWFPSVGFLWWVMPTEGGLMQGVMHLLQGGDDPGVSGCILFTNRCITGLDRPGWF